MTAFSAETFANSYLAAGATDVDAIITVTASGAGGLPAATGSGATEVIIVDTSGSMATGTRMPEARKATRAAVAELRDGVAFSVLSGAGHVEAVYPTNAPFAIADPRTRDEAARAVERLQPSGGTAIGRWLTAAGQVFAHRPGAINHAILLTDGKNEGEQPAELAAAVRGVTGVFQCDCRGVGTDWVVTELRSIAEALLGSVDIVAEPAGLSADFAAMMSRAMGKTAADVSLRVWTPLGATVRFVKQVAPEVVDLSGRRVEVPPRAGDYPTGAWGGESRDYHLAVTVKAGAVGEEMLAARVSVVAGTGPDAEVLAQSLVRAVWTDDIEVSTRINPSVAHYTGQAELASAIQEGLEARKAGDEDTATMRLGRAAQLAAQSGNSATAALLATVVDIEDAATGTVRLKKKVAVADEMALDTRSTKTVRVGRGT